MSELVLESLISLSSKTGQLPVGHVDLFQYIQSKWPDRSVTLSSVRDILLSLASEGAVTIKEIPCTTLSIIMVFECASVALYVKLMELKVASNLPVPDYFQLCQPRSSPKNWQSLQTRYRSLVYNQVDNLTNQPRYLERFRAKRFLECCGIGNLQKRLIPTFRSYCDDVIYSNCQTVMDASNVGCRKIHFKFIVQPDADLNTPICPDMRFDHMFKSCEFAHLKLNLNGSVDVDWMYLCVENAVQNALFWIEKENEIMGREYRRVEDCLDLKTTRPEWMSMSGRFIPRFESVYPTQWIQCDMRIMDFTLLGNVAVIMADPPWNIDITVVEEIVWVKNNQAQQLNRIGQTGVYLNHSKEHCLVGMKGSLPSINSHLDCDVIVSEVREVSRKPDEIYSLIERMVPNGRKVELFGRVHNLRPGWITLGNQLPESCIFEPDILDKINSKYASNCKPGINKLNFT